MLINNPEDRKKLLAKVPLLAEIDRQYGPPPAWSRPPGFISLVKIIIEQQVSLSSALAHFNRLSEYVGEVTPETLLALTEVEFRQCHISRQKRSYLVALSEAVLKKELVIDELGDLSEAEAKAVLMKVKGIGHWTADVYLMLCLQKKDVFPIGDIALRSALKALSGLTDPTEMIAFAEDWRPLRSLASCYLWHYYLEERGRKMQF